MLWTIIIRKTLLVAAFNVAALIIAVLLAVITDVNGDKAVTYYLVALAGITIIELVFKEKELDNALQAWVEHG